jgi:chromosome partitioning protein
MYRIMLSSPKGGCGKTHLTRNLAAAAAADGFSVSTADLDPQRTLTRWVRRRPGTVPGITHYEVDWANADTLTGDGTIPSTDLLIIDTPPSIEAHPAELKRLLFGVDLILVPCRTTFDDIESALPYLQTLADNNARAIVVLNATKPRVNVAPQKTMLLQAAEVCPIEIGERADYDRAASRGLSLIDLASHIGGDEIRGLWAYVKRQMQTSAKPAPVARKGKRHVQS